MGYVLKVYYPTKITAFLKVAKVHLISPLYLQLWQIIFTKLVLFSIFLKLTDYLAFYVGFIFQNTFYKS